MMSLGKLMRVNLDEPGKVRFSKLSWIRFRLEYAFSRFLLIFRQYKWRPYDPTWLVLLAEQQLPDEKWLHAALKNCTSASGTIPYIYFVTPRNANQPGAEWQFDQNITLEDPEKGDLILDVLKDGRIGGVEFLGVLLI